MKKFKVLIVIILCVFLCVPVLYGCEVNNNADATAHTYNIEAVLNETDNTLAVIEKLTFNNFSSATLSSIKLNVDPNAYREGAKFKIVPAYQTSAYPNGESYGAFTLNWVHEGATDANYNLCGDDENILEVALKSPLAPNKTCELEFNYCITLPCIRHRLGYADEVYTLTNFYLSPCKLEADGTFFESRYYEYGDPFYEDLANFNVKLTCNKNLNVFSSGTEQNTIINGSTKTTTLTATLCRSFGMAVSEKLKQVSGATGNIKVNYAYLTDPDPRASLNIAVDALNVFSSCFGPLDAKQITIVEAPYSFGGMEYTNFVLVTSDALTKHAEFEEIIVHELAHQWWYSAVGNNQVDCAFLDESLTEFSTMYYAYKKNGLTTLREKAAQNLNSHILFLEIERSVYENVDESIDRSLSEFNTSGEYGQIIYTRGSLMFYNLFELLGEKKFEKALQTYYKNNKNGFGSKQALVSAFNKAANKNLSGFFQNWLSGNINITQI